MLSRRIAANTPVVAVGNIHEEPFQRVFDVLDDGVMQISSSGADDSVSELTAASGNKNDLSTAAESSQTQKAYHLKQQSSSSDMLKSTLLLQLRGSHFLSFRALEAVDNSIVEYYATQLRSVEVCIFFLK